ncbi:MFS transporter [Micromonospora sp. NPDC049559]|uniref:MFS transporter n=1 Tax=Micromonospora sp. NPDC049559 TaxID=3155923 RepID=UPI0034462A4A
MTVLETGVANRLPTRWLILAVVCLAQLAVLLDSTVLNVAIPVLGTELGASTAEIQWTINSYALVQAGLLLTAGGLADRYGRKRALLAGLALFGVGSLAAGLAPSAGALVAARAGMGVGGALLTTSTLAVVMQVFDADERPRAIGVWAAVNALGFAAGPPIGGLLLAHFWWGAIFLVNLPVVALGLVAAWALLPESRGPAAGRPDLGGAALSTAGMSALVYAIISGPGHGWLSAHVLLPAGAGALLLAAFAGWERRVRHPMLDLDFFRNRGFVGAISGVVLVTFGSAGALFLLTQQLQFVRGYEPWEAGLRTAPFALSVVLLNFAGVSTRAIRALGVPLAIAAGMSLFAAGLVVVARSALDGYGGLLAGLILMGAGCALANPAIVAAVMGAIPADRAGTGAGIDGTLSEVGSGLGVAVLGAVMNARFVALLPGTAAGAASFPDALAAVHGGTGRAEVTEAFVAGLAAGQLVGAAAVLAGACLAALLLHRARRPGAAPRELAAPVPPADATHRRPD